MVAIQAFPIGMPHRAVKLTEATSSEASLAEKLDFQVAALRMSLFKYWTPHGLMIGSIRSPTKPKAVVTPFSTATHKC